MIIHSLRVDEAYRKVGKERSAGEALNEKCHCVVGYVG